MKPFDLALSLRERGEAERSRPGSDGGVAAYTEAIAILRGENVPLKLAHTIRHLGDIYRHLERYDEAGECYDEALALYRGHPGSDPLDLANALRGAALLMEKKGEIERAVAMWLEAKDLYQQANVAAGVEESARRVAALGRP